MIPKKIHYVWVGGNEKNNTIKQCMKTWGKHLEGYEVIEWNENNFDRFLNNRAFVGFENPQYPFTAVFGAEPGHPLVKDMIEYYDRLDEYKFDFEKNNTISVSDLLIKKYHCKVGNKFQILDEDIAVYPDTVLCNPSENSISIHVFTGTWLEGKKALARKINVFLKIHVTNKKRAKLFRKYIMRV